MAADNGVEATSGRIESQCLHVVQHQDTPALEFHGTGIGKAARPLPFVIVSTHGVNRRDSVQFVQDLRLADVARVDDDAAAAQCIERFGPQQTVGVGDKTDELAGR